MADEIINKCLKLPIIEEEEDIIPLDDETTREDMNTGLKVAIVGKVLFECPYSFEVFKKMINQIWSTSKYAIFRSKENYLFVIQFATCWIEQK